MNLQSDRAGEGGRLLVLLHGLGATRHVWHPMLARVDAHWRGSWIAPDLRGHGASPHAASYALGLHAADVADLVQGSGRWNEIVVVGHSMGGVVALALASGWFGIAPWRVFGLGIKVAWTADELVKLGEMAAAPVRRFDTKEEAITRSLKASGLTGLIEANSPAAEAGIVRSESGWRFASDPATASIGAPPMHALIDAAQAPIHLARGEADRMVTRDQLLAFDPAVADLAGLGHNAMVENPSAVWQWIESKCA
jgi:pimeloyl-ACP methyl ester carboxylesterase